MNDYNVFNEVRKVLKLFDESAKVRIFLWAVWFCFFLLAASAFINAIKWW